MGEPDKMKTWKTTSSPHGSKRKNAMPNFPLVRSRHDRLIWGVCGGIAPWLGGNSLAVRVAFVLLLITPAVYPGVLAHLVLAVILPLEAEVEE